MSRRDERIDKEAAALWRSLHDAAPPEGCSGTDLLDMIVRGCDVPQYQRLHTPSLRDRNLTWPKA